MSETPPLPRIPGKGWIVLIGGGEFSFGETREIDEFLVTRLPRNNRRIAFLPTASGSNEYATHLGEYFKSLAPEVEVMNVPVYRGRDARRGKNLGLIEQAGLVYLGGGVTNSFLDTIRLSPMEETMRAALSLGTTVAAIGGSAAALGGFARDIHRPGGALPGLNWIHGAAVEPNFDPANDVELRRLMAIPEVQLGIGIPVKTALAIGEDGVGQILGSGRIALVRKAQSSVQ